ncbi:pectate lyase family protein [Porcipelethomonas sp.]|uniref:pectate lyase family protein n=1 Tax=Porcipelethomonas sp. TaxID=2981675 RepID=UPI003EF213E2
MKFKKLVSCCLAAAIAAGGLITGNYSYISINSVSAESYLSAPVSTDVLKESAYVTWTPVSGADGYNVYCKPEGGSYTQLDSMLVRQYSGYFRADAVGLKPGRYIMKVVPTSGGKEDASNAVESEAITVGSYDRSGFAFSANSPNGGIGVGAYNDDGTLKDGAVVLYLTEDTKNTMTMDVVTDSKGGTTACTGISEILTALQNGYETRPVDIRIIGKVTADGVTGSGDENNLHIKASSASCPVKNITVEGIGEDAVCYGFGIRCVRSQNIEVRNLGIMLFGDDGIAFETANINIWVHNNDIFYGTAGSDSDQAKGDGSLDMKNDSQYFTISYNHFWDSGKMSLCGMTSETGENWITYHHNWFDHSDSRHPRIRTMSVHVYNNYYDGNAKYGVGAVKDADAFVEANYFRNCPYPMLTCDMGSDTGNFDDHVGAMIKSYGNYIVGEKSYITQNDNSTSFDAYEVSARNDIVPNSVKSLDGYGYNNFDTDSSIMYSYTPDAADDVPSIVMSEAGRLGGGDFEFEFTAADDEDYSVNTELMSKITSYTSPVIAIGSGFTSEDTPAVTTPAVTTAAVTESTSSLASTSVLTTASVKSTTKTSSEIVISADAVYCSPNGSASAQGTKDDPTDVATAISMAKTHPGITIYLLGGTYNFDTTIMIEEANSGTADARNTIMAYPGEEVVWDFSAMEVAGSNRGVVLDGSYWYFKGFEIKGAGDNGMLISGDNNIIEMMVFNDNQDTGLQISRYNSSYATIDQWPSNNLVLNCTSKNNCDNATMENADGFAAKLTCGEGNVFDGCMAYNNSDDGWDLFAKTETGPIGVVTIRNCIAFRNGYTETGEGYGDCDGNGFKLGGSGVGTAHIVENCLAFENLNCGFTDNKNPKLESLTNCTSYNNGVSGNDNKPNYSLYRCTDDGCDFSNIISYINETELTKALPPEVTLNISNDKFVGTIENSVYYNSSKYYNVTDKQTIASGNKLGSIVTLTDADFISITAPAMGTDFHKEWRNEDGTLNTGGFLETTSESIYADLGIDFQSIELPIIPVTTTTTAVSSQPTTETTVTTTVTAAVTTQENQSTVPSDAVATLYGDVNLDGTVSSTDVVLLNKYLLSQTEYPLPELSSYANADCEYDGIIDLVDSSKITENVLGITPLSELGLNSELSIVN